MDIGLNILDNLRISIGEETAEIINALKRNSIGYSIPYQGQGHMIIFIETYGVELNTVKDQVVFIKSSNSKLNYIMKIGMNTPALVLAEIREKLAKNFNLPISKIRIDRFESTSSNSIMSIPYDEGHKVKISLVLGLNNGIYIETMQLVNT